MKKLIATSMAIALGLGVQAGGVDAAAPTKVVKQAHVYQLNQEQLQSFLNGFNTNFSNLSPALKEIINAQINCELPVKQQKPTVGQPKQQQPQKPVVQQPQKPVEQPKQQQPKQQLHHNKIRLSNKSQQQSKQMYRFHNKNSKWSI